MGGKMRGEMEREGGQESRSASVSRCEQKAGARMDGWLTTNTETYKAAHTLHTPRSLHNQTDLLHLHIRTADCHDVCPYECPDEKHKGVFVRGSYVMCIGRQTVERQTENVKRMHPQVRRRSTRTTRTTPPIIGKESPVSSAHSESNNEEH